MCECLAEMLCTVGSKRGKAEVAARATRVTMAAVSTSMYSSLLSPRSTTRARSESRTESYTAALGFPQHILKEAERCDIVMLICSDCISQ